MSLDRHLGFPNNWLHLVMACTEHYAEVVRVDDPTGSGRVMVKCKDIWGNTRSNWILCDDNNPAPTDKKRKQSGMWNPARPKQTGMVYFPGGDLTNPRFRKAGAHMNAKGNAGTKV